MKGKAYTWKDFWVQISTLLCSTATLQAWVTPPTFLLWRVIFEQSPCMLGYHVAALPRTPLQDPALNHPIFLILLPPAGQAALCSSCALNATECTEVSMKGCFFSHYIIVSALHCYLSLNPWHLGEFLTGDYCSVHVCWMNRDTSKALVPTM